jgi:DDE_Tnp_1-associated
VVSIHAGRDFRKNCFDAIQAKEQWFTELLGLAQGIPSHDIFGEVYAAIDTDHFSDCFSRWAADLADLAEGKVIAIDGKCLRRSLDKASKKGRYP